MVMKFPKFRIPKKFGTEVKRIDVLTPLLGSGLDPQTARTIADAIEQPINQMLEDNRENMLEIERYLQNLSTGIASTGDPSYLYADANGEIKADPYFYQYSN